MKVLIIDNYDSFTYNLVHYVEALGANVDVVYNNEIPFESVLNYDKVILSPGPGLPKDAGQLMELISKFHMKIPILGVCLGFQALVEFYGGEIYNQKEVKHGVKTLAFFDTKSILFTNTKASFNVGLYHSWAAKKENFPPNLLITGSSELGTIMAFEQNNENVYGVQFHPESILTEFGHKIIENYLGT